MQPWDSILVSDPDSKYNGTAGCIVAVDNDKRTVTARMDLDGQNATFPVGMVKRLG